MKHDIEPITNRLNYHCFQCMTCGKEAEFKWNNNPDYQEQKEAFFDEDCKPIKPKKKRKRRKSK